MTDVLKKTLTEWCERHISAQIAESLDQGASPVTLYKEMAANGWLQYANIIADKENFYRLALVCEIANSYSGVLGNMLCVNAACAMMLGMHGSGEHKALAQQILAGEKLAAFSLTEADAGTDVQNVRASAHLENDRWHLQGEKYLATGAAIADVLLVVVRTNQEVAMNKGTSLLVVPSDAQGLRITPLPKMAANGYASCHLSLDGVQIPAQAVLGQANGAWGTLAFAGGIERVLVAACCVGLCRTIGKYLYDYAQVRQINGQPLYALTNISHQIVEIAIKVRAADSLVKHAIEALLSGQNPTNAICAAKVFSAQMQQEVAMTAMQVMGGRSYLKAYPLERWLREGLLALWAGGTNELQKNLMSRNPFA